MTIDTERLIRLFLDLAVVDAVSFRETPVAKFIREYIDDASVTCITAGRPPSGDCDNLICIPDGVDRSKIHSRGPIQTSNAALRTYGHGETYR
jgi:hypothetical protein